MAFHDSPPEDIRATLAVSQEEARLGGSRVINLPGGRTTTVRVPAGIRDGEEIRVPGQGDTTEGGAGNLILRVSVVSVDRFQNDLEDASPTQAVSMPPVDQPSPGYNASGYAATPAPPYLATSTPPEAAGGNYTPLPQSPIYLQTPAGGPQSYPGFGPYPNYPAPGQIAQPVQNYIPPAYPTYPPQQTPPPQRKRSGTITTLIVLIVLLLLVGSGLFFYLGYYQPNQAHSAGTATAQAQTLGTANAQASSTAQITRATAQAAATSTAQVQATAQTYQNLYTQATSGTPVLNDQLNTQTSSQWDETSTANGSCKFANGGYHSSIPTSGYFQPCYAENTNFSNFAFQVDMTITQGDEGGIIFRADTVNDKFYLFQADINGNYALYLYSNNQGSQAVRLMSGTTDLMRGVGQSNEITLVARASNLSFYLNKHFLNSASDGTYTSGKIGVLAESATQATDAAFTNAKVWTL